MPRRRRGNRKRKRPKQQKSPKRSKRPRIIRWDRAKIEKWFKTGKWSVKRLMGKKNSIRTPCIRVLNKDDQLDGSLYAYKAAWIFKKGEVPPGVVIVHDCTVHIKTGKPISACINVRHMRLKDNRFNQSQRICQNKLVKYWQANKYTKSFEGPLFVEDLPGDHTCSHGEVDGTGRCFLNCKFIKYIVGMFWY